MASKLVNRHHQFRSSSIMQQLMWVNKSGIIKFPLAGCRLFGKALCLHIQEQVGQFLLQVPIKLKQEADQPMRIRLRTHRRFSSSTYRCSARREISSTAFHKYIYIRACRAGFTKQ